MVFPRGKVGGSQPANGSSQIAAKVPRFVRPGDFCVMWVMTSTTTATISVPSWLQQLNLAAVTGAANCIQYAGFFPGDDYNLTVNCNDTTKGWLISASFWGGVDQSDPYSFPQFTQSGSGATAMVANIQAIVAKDNLNVGFGVALDGVVADRGGTWVSHGPGDFVGLGTFGVYRNTTGDTDPTFSVLPSASTMTATLVNVPSRIDAPMLFNTDIVQSGVTARYVDVDNYVAAFLELSPYSYSSVGANYAYNLGSSKYVVEVCVAGVISRFEIPGPKFPAVSYTGIAFDTQHALSISKDGLLNYSAHSTVDASAPVDFKITVDTMRTVLGPGGVLDEGKAGLYDRNAGAGTSSREYFSFQTTGTANDAPVIVVLGGFVCNADTISMRATPNDPVNIDEQTGGTVPDPIGRALSHRYFFMPSLQDVTVTLTDNYESVSLDILTIGSIVLNSADPSPYGKTTLVPTHRSKQRKKSGWKFYLANTQTYEHIALMRAVNRNINWTLNRPGSATFDIRLDSEAAKKIEVAETCLIAYRDGDAKWSGPIWTIAEDTDPDVMNVSAVGWLQLLEKRLLRPADERYARFGQTDAAVIAAHLLALENAKDPLPFTISEVIGTQLRKRSYQRYQSMGNEIQALADIESGYDIWIDPNTRELVFWNRLEEDLSKTVAFGYKAGLIHNLANVKRTRSADRLVNGIHVTTKTPGSTPAQQIDPESVQRFGLFEEQAALSETTDSTVAIAYAAGELVYRSTPLQIFSLTPKQHGGQTRVPRPLQDYHIGTVVKFSAKRGSIDVEDQKARVFALGLSLDNEGRETVTNLATTVAG